MNTQEIFTKVATHLLTQNAKSLANSICAYRGDNGLKCAVGVLIADEHYSPMLEGMSTRYNEVICAVRSSIGRALTADEWWLISRFQEIHDSSSPEHWHDEIYSVASNLGLEMPVIT